MSASASCEASSVASAGGRARRRVPGARCRPAPARQGADGHLERRHRLADAGARRSPADLQPFYMQQLHWKALQDSVPVLDADRADGLRPPGAALPAPGADPAAGQPTRSTGSARWSSTPAARAARASTTPGRPTTVISSAVRKRYDVVGFDPRGVGRSDPVQCLTDKQTDAFIAADPTPTTPAEIAAAVALAKAFAARLPGPRRRAARLRRHPRRGPRPGRHALGARRRQALLPGQVLRHVPRRDVRRRVPDPRRADGARRRHRPVADVASRSTSARPRASSWPPARSWPTASSGPAARSGATSTRPWCKLGAFLRGLDAHPLPHQGALAAR